MENMETKNLSNILQTSGNSNENTSLQDIPGLPLNTLSDLDAFNQKLSEDEIFCNNVVSKQYISTYMAIYRTYVFGIFGCY